MGVCGGVSGDMRGCLVEAVVGVNCCSHDVKNLQWCGL